MLTNQAFINFNLHLQYLLFQVLITHLKNVHLLKFIIFLLKLNFLMIPHHQIMDIPLHVMQLNLVKFLIQILDYFMIKLFLNIKNNYLIILVMLILFLFHYMQLFI